MTSNPTAVPPPIAQPLSPLPRLACGPSSSYAGIAALAAAFAGIVTYGRESDMLSTALAMGLTFLGAWFVLCVLQFVFRLVVTVTKVVIFAAAILLVGCVLDWHWAECAVDWLRTFGGHAVEAAENGWTAWQAR